MLAAATQVFTMYVGIQQYLERFSNISCFILYTVRVDFQVLSFPILFIYPLKRFPLYYIFLNWRYHFSFNNFSDILYNISNFFPFQENSTLSIDYYFLYIFIWLNILFILFLHNNLYLSTLVGGIYPEYRTLAVDEVKGWKEYQIDVMKQPR